MEDSVRQETETTHTATVKVGDFKYLKFKHSSRFPLYITVSGENVGDVVYSGSLDKERIHKLFSALQDMEKLL